MRSERRDRSFENGMPGCDPELGNNSAFVRNGRDFGAGWGVRVELEHIFTSLGTKIAVAFLKPQMTTSSLTSSTAHSVSTINKSALRPPVLRRVSRPGASPCKTTTTPTQALGTSGSPGDAMLRFPVFPTTSAPTMQQRA